MASSTEARVIERGGTEGSATILSRPAMSPPSDPTLPEMLTDAAQP